MTKLDSKIIKFKFGTAEIFDNYLVMVMNEGVTVIPEYNDDLLRIAKTIFAGRNFAYISHRLNSYSVDPSVYHETSKIKNLVAFAVVSEEKIHFTTAQIERIFLKKPMRVFTRLKEAINWVDSIINP